MIFRKNFRTIFLLIGSVIVCLVYYTHYFRQQSIKLTRIIPLLKVPDKNTFETEIRAQYEIYTPSCKMLAPDPWNKSILKYLKNSPSLSCSRLPLLTYIEQRSDLTNVLKIDKKALASYKSHKILCCYSVINRITQNIENYNISADSLYTISNCSSFEDQVELPTDAEFLIVHCYNIKKNKSQKKEIYRDAHAVIPKPSTVRLKKLKQQKIQETDQSSSPRLNIIIIGIDSISKLNFRRTMPKTLNYLLENNWIQLNGYNKIGENTFPNLMAILSGLPMPILEEMCWANHSQKIDDCPMIWKEYQKKGYVTLYAEDTPSISTFNLLRTGFVEKPTDYYMRPFMLATHEQLKLKVLNGLPVCLGPVLIVDHIFNYAKRFFRTFNSFNYFSLLWLNSLSHNDVNSPRALDISLHRFLNELSDTGTYNNSLILLLSDHGVRFGDIRETFLGYLEERLPFMFIWLPDWFKENYSNMYNNLIINQNRLTSPYDVYVTLKKLLGNDDTYSPSLACPKCNGLLEVQPEDRTCADASIDANWCLCSEYRDVRTRDRTVLQIGKHLFKSIVNYTNELIKKEDVQKSLCSKWKFLRVIRANEILLPNVTYQYSLRNISNSEILRLRHQQPDLDTKIFVIIIEVRPGRTKFESTVQINLNKMNSEISNFAFLEPPKRLDSMYKTSKCVKNLLLKHYCYCLIQK